MMKFFSMSSFVGGFMLGVVVVGVWTYREDLPLPLPPEFTDLPVEADTTSRPESGAIAVPDQPAGSSVTIESIIVPPSGVWIAVREMIGTSLGNVLGAVRVTGPRTDITVPLLRRTEPGHSYAVQLYRDDGGNTFDLANDSVYIDFATEAPVITYFSTTGYP